jgi:hypothetical protein
MGQYIESAKKVRVYGCVDDQAVGTTDTDSKPLEHLADLGEKTLLGRISHREEEAGFFMMGLIFLGLYVQIEAVMFVALLVKVHDPGNSLSG